MALALILVAAATLLPAHGAVGSVAPPSAWRCFTCNPIWLADAISNVALFVPLGVTLALFGARAPHALLIGSALSLGIELLQWSGVPSGRAPALADWLTNSAGTLLGAWMVKERARLVHPAPRMARRLCAGWTALALAVLWASRWALSPATPAVGTGSPVALSPLPFTPGHGWYAALADSATVNGVRIPHGGTGPVIAVMARTDTVRVSVVVRGRDDREGVVPIVFVHAPGDTVAHLLLAQRGASAVLGTALNAGRIGLISPVLALPAMFEPGVRGPDAAVRLRGVVTSGTLSLVAREPRGVERSAMLSLSPVFGWALVQAVVRVDSAAGRLMSVLWVLMWLVPWGYWLARGFLPDFRYVPGDPYAPAHMTVPAVSSEFSIPLTPGLPDASTGEVSVALARAQLAVNRARAAQPAWAAIGAAGRARIIERFRQLVYAEREVIARTVTEESGKPMPESYVADVAMALEGARFLSRIAEVSLASRTVRSQTLAAWRKTITTHYEPYGVVAVVSPWNYPFFFPAMHAMSALVAGNAVVLKPSEHTPRCVDHLARLLHVAGVPADVFIVLHGDGRMGAALVNATVNKVFFTGSERTGRSIAVSCAPRFVPVSLELGGSDAAIVLEDADMDIAASGILWARFSNAGQTCVAAKRVIAVGRAYDELLPRLARGVAGLSVEGDTADAGSKADMGPLITAGQRALIMEQLDDAVAQGATVVARQEPRLSASASAVADRQVSAVVLSGVTPAMRVWHEETFGPVLAVVRADSEAEAVAMANSTRYGLSASVWTKDRSHGARIAAQLEAGTMAINDAVITAGLPEVPHGGEKASGLGRIHGVEGLMECVRTRTVVDDALPGMRQPWWFGYGPQSTARLDAYLRVAHGQSWWERLSGIPGTLKMLLRPERPL